MIVIQIINKIDINRKHYNINGNKNVAMNIN